MARGRRVLGACALLTACSTAAAESALAPATTADIATVATSPAPGAGEEPTKTTLSPPPTMGEDPTGPATAPATAPITTAPPATEPATARTITLAFTGDTLPHSPLWRRAADNAAVGGGTGFDFTPMLAGLAPVVAGVDLAVCHLETPIAPAGEALSTMPFYGVPAEIADAIAAAGFDRCSTASNHALDRGSAGIDRTVAVLEAAGLGQSGMARSPTEIEPVVFDIGGVRLAHLSYTWSFNGLRLPLGEEWRSALIDPIRIVEDARAARALGAEAVVVSLHWGTEGQHEPTQYQRDVAAWLTASGSVDLIVGHHAHVVQPIEQVNGIWVVYGLGNILSNLPTSENWPAASQDAMVVTTSLTVAPDGSVTVDRPQAHPTWVDKHAGWIVRLVDPELTLPDLPDGLRQQLTASRERTVAVVGEYVDASVAP